MQMDEACDMVALPWVLRKAIAVLNVLEVCVAAGVSVGGKYALQRWHYRYNSGRCCSLLDQLRQSRISLLKHHPTGPPTTSNAEQLEDAQSHFATNMKAGGVLDVVERYPWTGEAVEHPRRDKRRGRHTAYVRRTEDGHPCIVCVALVPGGSPCVAFARA